MNRLLFDFDVVSPYSYLAFELLPEALEGCSCWVEYRPVLFAGLLKAHGHKGPAEISPKREWMWRQVAWLAQRHQLPLQPPQLHPFNPLALQRLALACAAPGGLPNRRIVEAVMRHVWRADGADPNDPQRLAALREELQPQQDPAAPAIKQALRTHTDQALAEGVFGVPTMHLRDAPGPSPAALFWGVDSLEMLREAALAPR